MLDTLLPLIVRTYQSARRDKFLLVKMLLFEITSLYASAVATQKVNFYKEQKRRRDSPALMISDFRPLLRKVDWSHQRCGMGLQLPVP